MAHKPNQEPATNNITKLAQQQSEGKGEQVAAIKEEALRLAQLDAVEYLVERDSAAKDLGIGVGQLDKIVQEARARLHSDEPGVVVHDPELWDKKVNGAEQLDQMADAFRRHIVLADGFHELLALWTMHCHCYEAFYITPRLRVTSPVPECGKTLVLDVLARLTPRSRRAEHISPAAMFRFIDKYQPILLVDEADTFLRQNDELRGVIDSGHRKDGSIIRVVGDDLEPCAFKTFGPVALAGLGEVHSTIASRSLTVEMQRRLLDQEIVELTPAQYPRLEELNRKAARWAADHFEILKDTDPDMPPGVINRLRDNWKPLLAIADAAEGHWPETARKVALQVTARAREDADLGIVLLEDIKNIFARKGKIALSSNRICEGLRKMVDRPWGEFRHGKPITTRQLAALLRPFRVSPGTIRLKTRTMKGYRKAQFKELWERYLPPSPSEGQI